MFTIQIYCPDCTGQDPYGCFDGGVEHVTIDPTSGRIGHGGSEVAKFALIEYARKIGERLVKDTVWGYEILLDGVVYEIH